jgi:hypothetical protein
LTADRPLGVKTRIRLFPAYVGFGQVRTNRLPPKKSMSIGQHHD